MELELQAVVGREIDRQKGGRGEREEEGEKGRGKEGNGERTEEGRRGEERRWGGETVAAEILDLVLQGLSPSLGGPQGMVVLATSHLILSFLPTKGLDFQL